MVTYFTHFKLDFFQVFLQYVVSIVLFSYTLHNPTASQSACHIQQRAMCWILRKVINRPG